MNNAFACHFVITLLIQKNIKVFIIYRCSLYDIFYISCHRLTKKTSMKTLFKVLVFSIIFSSCKRDEVVFSCDPILNQYVSTHQAVLKSLSLTDLTNSDLVFQQAAFRSYDATRKREVWIQKIQSLLVTQIYSPDEFAHVNSLLNHLHENYFIKENIESERNERKQFATDWINKAKNSLGWTDQQVAFVVYRLYTTTSQFDTELRFIQSIQQQNSIQPTGNCGCSTSTDFCSGSALCNSGSCSTSTGCGWMWSQACDGTCR